MGKEALVGVSDAGLALIRADSKEHLFQRAVGKLPLAQGNVLPLFLPMFCLLGFNDSRPKLRALQPLEDGRKFFRRALWNTNRDVAGVLLNQPTRRN